MIVEHGERLRELETDMKHVKLSVSNLTNDIKALQNRWAFIMGIIMVLSRTPEILHFIGGR